MKVALNQMIHQGAWGGGNRFAAALTETLLDNGHKVVHALQDDDIDIILILDPRPANPLLAFTAGAVFRHLCRNPRPIVVHRINECDERKGTRLMNARLRTANYVADHTVFIASWLKDLSVWRRESSFSVILNGGDARIFNPAGQETAQPGRPLRLVTHHWGAHAMKGFDVYARLDALLAAPPWQDKLEFTYIGNLPGGFSFTNARHLPPLDGAELAQELRRHHVYLTASINEPAGMHHIEGALCGLPILYRASGALPEYCSGFGEPFNSPDDFPTSLERMIRGYSRHRDRMTVYPHSSSRMVSAYLELFDGLLTRAEAIRSRRRLFRSPLAALAAQVMR